VFIAQYKIHHRFIDATKRDSSTLTYIHNVQINDLRVGVSRVVVDGLHFVSVCQNKGAFGSLFKTDFRIERTELFQIQRRRNFFGGQYRGERKLPFRCSTSRTSPFKFELAN
jgi:hypothetical protein